MCGIAGFTHKNTRVDAARIRSITASLLHRGPDQQGIYHSDSVSLGAVRLKIIDLAGGEQPMHSPDGDVVIAFNGEIYNHDALREELRAHGHQFQSRCDTEVVLKAFLEWDTDCFARLRGMFGVALWTESCRRLVLARDRMGIKPLYFRRQGEELYFGSELKAILEHPELDRRLDLTGLSYYLSLNYVPCPFTLVEGIEKLPPGQWLEWQDGVVRTQPYWELRFQPEARHTEESAKAELDALLRDAVREHMISDVPLGVWSSGGLDSTTILHYASQHSERPLKTFSVSFQGQSCDESAYFRQVARHYGTEHEEFDLNAAAELPQAVEELGYYSDEPSADAGALPVWFLSRMTRQRVTVALTGDGADELFGGYLTYKADRYARQFRRAVPRWGRQWMAGLARHWPVSDQKISLEYKVKRFLQGSLLSEEEAHLFWNGTFSAAEKARVCRFADHPPLSSLYAALPHPPQSAGDVNPFLYLDQHYYLADDILYKCDRMSMAHSLELRPPFLDHRVVEFAASLPQSLKIQGGSLKHLLRSLMADKLPPAVLARKKEGFDIPAHGWLRGVLRPLLEATLTREAVEATGVFHWPAVRQLLQAHQERRANVGYHLWGLLILFLWMRRWGIQTSSARETAPMVARPVGFSNWSSS